MSWTYYAGNVGTSDLSTLRLLLGDTSSGDQQFADEEIGYFVDSSAGLYNAAAMACQTLATGYARRVDKAVGDLKISYGQRSAAYREMATDYRRQAKILGRVRAYAGGISVTDKSAVESDEDRVIPAFERGMHDYPGSLPSSSS